jgi:hypothetical protein
VILSNADFLGAWPWHIAYLVAFLAAGCYLAHRNLAGRLVN